MYSGECRALLYIIIKALYIGTFTIMRRFVSPQPFDPDNAIIVTSRITQRRDKRIINLFLNMR